MIFLWIFSTSIISIILSKMIILRGTFDLEICTNFFFTTLIKIELCSLHCMVNWFKIYYDCGINIPDLFLKFEGCEPFHMPNHSVKELELEPADTNSSLLNRWSSAIVPWISLKRWKLSSKKGGITPQRYAWCWNPSNFWREYTALRDVAKLI